MSMLSEITATLRAGDARALKLATLAFFFVAIAVTTHQSTSHSRGIIRRICSGYVARMEAQQKAAWKPVNGTRIAWVQLAIVLFLFALYGVVPQDALLVVAAGVVIAPPIALRRDLALRRKKLDDQAHGFALVLANALKATASIGDAMRGATEVTSAPLKQELQTVLRQIGVGSTMEDALLELSARVQSSALDVVVSALLIGRQTGGDLPRILEGTAASLRDLKRLEAHTDKVTRSAKQSLGASAAITVGIAAMLPHLFPGFLEPLRTTLKGQVYAAQMFIVFFFALYLGWRFTRKSI